MHPGARLTVENKTWLTWRGVVDDRQLVVDLYLAGHIGAGRILEFLRPRYYVSNIENLINDTTF